MKLSAQGKLRLAAKLAFAAGKSSLSNVAVTEPAAGRFSSFKGSHLALAAALVLGSVSAPAMAATFVVNSTGDSVDANPGDGQCLDANSLCTLRAAIMEANKLGGSNTITFSPVTDGTPIVLTLTGAHENADATGDLDITSSLTITGNVDANGNVVTIVDGDASSAGKNADRVFDVRGGTVSMSNLIVQNGGGVDTGGGIRVLSGASLSLNAVQVINNTATGATGVVGGGVDVEAGANFSATACTFSGNAATSTAGTASGGGVYLGTSNAVTIDSSEISGNTVSATGGAGSGGGIQSASALTLQNGSILRGNSASSDGQAFGGGVDVSGGSLSLSQTEVTSNTVTGAASAGGGMGGGVYSSGGFPTSLTNVTFAGNQADKVPAIYQSGSTLGMTNVTVANNSGDVGAVTLASSAVFSLSNTLIAANTDSAGAEADCNDGGGSGGTLTSLGYNLIGDTTGCTITALSTDQFGTASSPIDPSLGSLKALASIEGGGNSTRGLLPLSNSPALDKGDPQTQSSGGTCANKDQLGNSRPFGAACDIGAIERQADHAPVAKDGTLVMHVNQAVPGKLSATDKDGDPLTYTIVAPPAHGTLSGFSAATGKFTYTPASGYTGSDSFTFTASDGIQSSNTGTITVTVQSTPPPSAGGGGGAFDPLALLGLLAFLPRRLRRKA